MEIAGCKAAIVAEFTDECGNRITVPLVDANYIPANPGYGELRIPFTGGWIDQALQQLDDHKLRTGNRIV